MSQLLLGIPDTREMPAYNQTTMLAFCMITENLDEQYSNPIKLANWLLVSGRYSALSSGFFLYNIFSRFGFGIEYKMFVVIEESFVVLFIGVEDVAKN